MPALPRIKIVDVGAMRTVEDDAYARLMAALPCDIVGFEPVEAECAVLTAQNLAGRTYLPHVIGDGQAGTFHLCNVPYTSSLLQPNLPLVERFQHLAEYMQVVETKPVQTVRLDDLPETAGVDFLKVDVQGGELRVLEGAADRLKTALLIHIEVSFVELYVNQPLFADIDAHLRARGFQFHTFVPYGRPFKPLMVQGRPNGILSQMLWADAVYVSDFMRFDRLPRESLFKLAAILHENYQAFDLASVALAAFDRRLQVEYLNRLTSTR